MRIRLSYGPVCCERIGGYAAVVDPIGFPRRCVYDCIYCPVQGEPMRSLSPTALIPPDAITGDLGRLLDEIQVERLGGILIYGSGDPLLNPWLPMVIDGARRIASEAGLDTPVYAVTTGHLLSKTWGIEAAKSLDALYVRVDGGGDVYQLIDSPHPQARLRRLVEAVRGIDRDTRERIIFEVTLVEAHAASNTGLEALEEIAAILSMARASSVLLKTITRPPRRTGVKPANTRSIRRAREVLEERGFKVIEPKPCSQPCSQQAEKTPSPELLYNTLLRNPMTLAEITSAYSIQTPQAAALIKALEEKGLVEKAPWKTMIYYRGTLPQEKTWRR